MENDFRPGDHHFVAFPAHLFDEDRDLHFPARIDFKCPGGFGIVDLERDVAAGFADKPLAHVAGGDELSIATGKGRIVDQDPHPNGGRIDVDKLQRRALLAIGQGFADVNFLETGQADDVTGAGVLGLDLFQAGIGEERGHIGAFAASVAMNANHGVADRDATADDAPESDPPEVIAVVKVGDEHLEIAARSQSSEAG